MQEMQWFYLCLLEKTRHVRAVFSLRHTSSGGSIWGPSHEIGHNHQASINVVGATEVSNNLFSNVNVFLHGISTTRGSTVTKTLEHFAKDTGWFGMGIWEQTRMYYQLYLYFHAQGHKPDFYPTLSP